MSETPISPLRARMIEDMSVRKFGEKTQNEGRVGPPTQIFAIKILFYFCHDIQCKRLQTDTALSAENGLSREDHDQDEILGPRSQRRSRTIRNKPAALERLRRERRASTARSLRSKGSEVPACSCTKESRCSE
jgi:hypothetical protein